MTFLKSIFFFSILSHTQESYTWTLVGLGTLLVFSYVIKKKLVKATPPSSLPSPSLINRSPITSLLLFREGEAPPCVSSLGHQVSAGLDVSSPIEALPGSPGRGRDSNVRQQS